MPILGNGAVVHDQPQSIKTSHDSETVASQCIVLGIHVEEEL